MYINLIIIAKLKFVIHLLEISVYSVCVIAVDRVGEFLKINFYFEKHVFENNTVFYIW